MALRLVDSGLVEPAYSAAADEVIFSARMQNLVLDTLHFYVRKRPTVSLGYFQSVQDDIDLEYCRREGIRIVRRVTGGSAIFTDSSQLIYGLTVKDTLPKDKIEAYRVVCSALAAGLEKLGVRAEYKPVNDLLVDGKKISGSAQTRKDGYLLQHGTLILELDTERMTGALRELKSENMTSLNEVLGRPPVLDNVKTAIASGFGEVFETDIEKGALIEWENAEIERLISEKYGNDDWNYKR